jgi:hypothetical protein
MKKTILILTIALLGTTSLSAQLTFNRLTDTGIQSDLILLDNYIKKNEKGMSFKDPSSYLGTPYTNPKYLSGNIYKNDKILATNIALRFNSIADEMEVKANISAPDDAAKVLTKSEDVYVKIGNDIFVFVPYQGGIENGGYFQVLLEGSQMQLYKKHTKKFTPERKATSTITRGSKAKFEDRPEYFIVTRTGKFYALPNSNKKKLKVFGTNKERIKEFIESNSLYLSKEADLIKVINYYDDTAITN